jgi:hypothetical protein
MIMNKILSLLLMALCITSCSTIGSKDLSGPEVSKYYTVKPFTSIDISNAIDAEFIQTQGDSLSVLVTTTEPVMKDMVVETKGNQLLIGYNSPVFIGGNRPEIHVIIKGSHLNGINIAGASTLNIKTLKSDNLTVKASGASGLNINSLLATRLDAEASGASGIKLNGKVLKASFKSHGASKVDAYKLQSEQTEVNASGASDIRCYASVSITGEASGASNVNYIGSPKNANVSVSGASDVKSK